MNKAHFFLLCFSLLLISCNNKEVKPANAQSGPINEVSVIIDDQLWNGEVGDSIRNKFAAPVLGLPQEEPVFTLKQYPVKLLEGFMTNSRNIIVVKKESKSQFRIENNEFTKPQVVVHISGSNVLQILDTIQSNDSLIIKRIKDSEIKVYQDKIKHDSLLDISKIRKKFNIQLNVPNKYKIVYRRRKFIWLKKEITSGNLSLIFYQIPYSSVKDDASTVKRIMHIRDSIGRLYIHGVVSRTRMVTENAFSPYLSKIKIYNKPTFETRGNWEMLNDFMNGPFINYAILDKANHRILVIEGFCYAPSKQKRDLMFELESIIKSVQFLKKK
jgi:hypothetical protein